MHEKERGILTPLPLRPRKETFLCSFEDGYSGNACIGRGKESAEVESSHMYFLKLCCANVYNFQGEMR